jgi:hypothetical protein
MQSLIRLSGLGLVVCGTLAIIGELLQPSGGPTSPALSPRWTPALTLLMLANLALALGLVGLHLRQAERAGALGLVAFVLALFGTCLSVALTAIQGYVFPYVAAQPGAPVDPNLFISANGPLALAAPLQLGFLVLSDIGFILMGVAMLRAGVFSRASSWLLLGTSIATNVFFLGNELLISITFIAWALAFVVIGYELLTQRRLGVTMAARGV